MNKEKQTKKARWVRQYLGSVYRCSEMGPMYKVVPPSDVSWFIKPINYRYI